MRVLTIIMVIIAPATLVASIYGMNIPLPGGLESGNLLPLGLLLLVMVFIGLGMIVYARRRKWL